jgi:hypothetical protein
MFGILDPNEAITASGAADVLLVRDRLDGKHSTPLEEEERAPPYCCPA